MSFLIALLSKMEKEFWSLLENKWASEDGGHLFRNEWITSLRSCRTVKKFKRLLLTFEDALRMICFNPDWWKNYPEELLKEKKKYGNAFKNEVPFNRVQPCDPESSALGYDADNRTQDIYNVDKDQSIGTLVKLRGEWETVNYKHSMPLGKFGPPRGLLRKASLCNAVASCGFIQS